MGPVHARNRDGSFLFADEEEYVARGSNDSNIVYLKFEGFRGRELPKLPPRLQILVFQHSAVELFPPDLPTSVVAVYGRGSRVESLPDLGHHENMETMDLHDSMIVEVTAPLPPNLRTLDLSYNKLRRMTCALPDGLTSLNLSFNKFDADLEAVPDGCRVDSDHMYSDEYEWAGRSRRGRVGPRVRTIYDDAQNVHDSHVQRNVSSSVGKLIELTHGKRLPDVQEVVRALYGRFSIIVRIFGFIVSGHPICHVSRWCDDPTISSIHGITYKELLTRMYVVVSEHKDRAGLEEIMRDDIRASIGYCFTGRFTRLINVLTGFVDGMGVSISSREQMQGRIAQVVSKGQEESLPREEIVRRVEVVLDEFDVSDEGERMAWLDAIE